MSPPETVTGGLLPQGSMLEADENLMRRRRTQSIAKGLLLSAALLTVLFLGVLLVRLFIDGTIIFQGSFWANRYLPSGVPVDDNFHSHKDITAGIRDSIFSTLIMLLVTLAFAVPVGTAAGIYLQEYARPGRLTDWAHSTVSNLAAVPSIVYGLLGLAVFKFMLGLGASHASAGLTLGVLVLPIIIVATEEALKTVPTSVRQASLAMGATKWQTIRHHVIPYAMPGILTGQILAMSRAAGESAPLIALAIPTFKGILEYGLLDPGTPLQMRAYNLALDFKASAKILAGGAILVLLLVTLLLNMVAIIVRQRLQSKIRW